MSKKMKYGHLDMHSIKTKMLMEAICICFMQKNTDIFLSQNSNFKALAKKKTEGNWVIYLHCVRK